MVTWKKKPLDLFVRQVAVVVVGVEAVSPSWINRPWKSARSAGHRAALEASYPDRPWKSALEIGAASGLEQNWLPACLLMPLLATIACLHVQPVSVRSRLRSRVSAVCAHGCKMVPPLRWCKKKKKGKRFCVLLLLGNLLVRCVVAPPVPHNSHSMEPGATCRQAVAPSQNSGRVYSAAWIGAR